MRSDWRPVCLVPACDLNKVTWPIEVVVLQNDLTLREKTWADASPDILLAISLSSEGAALISSIPMFEQPHLRLIEENVETEIINFISNAMGHAQHRIVVQCKELAQMRQFTERVLRDFERLEAFVWVSGRGERILTTDLAPIHEELLSRLEQRLPGDSAGLSDVAVWTGGGNGELTATISLIESGEVVSEWRVQNPESGWLRLALPRALGSDSQTAQLTLDWRGQDLMVARSFEHPDVRFQCNGGRMLAMRLWKFIAGVAAPLAPGSMTATRTRGRWLIGPAALGEQCPDGFEIHENTGISARISGAMVVRLPRAARPGMYQISVFLTVEGPPVMAFIDGQPQVQTVTNSAQLVFFPPLIEEPRDIVINFRADDAATIIINRVEALSKVSE